MVVNPETLSPKAASTFRVARVRDAAATPPHPTPAHGSCETRERAPARGRRPRAPRARPRPSLQYSPGGVFPRTLGWRPDRRGRERQGAEAAVPPRLPACSQGRALPGGEGPPRRSHRVTSVRGGGCGLSPGVAASWALGCAPSLGRPGHVVAAGPSLLRSSRARNGPRGLGLLRHPRPRPPPGHSGTGSDRNPPTPARTGGPAPPPTG